jgi:hypothetical protein
VTPRQRIRREILLLCQEAEPELFAFDPPDTGEAVDAAWDKYRHGVETGDQMGDTEADIRCGEVATGLPTDYSRHFSCKEVAYRLRDGTWLGWTYWYGGGKYAEPRSIDWMAAAYELTVTEQEKVVRVRTFTRGGHVSEVAVPGGVAG